MQSVEFWRIRVCFREEDCDWRCFCGGRVG
jgi:hypothetical protein